MASAPVPYQNRVAERCCGACTITLAHDYSEHDITKQCETARKFDVLIGLVVPALFR